MILLPDVDFLGAEFLADDFGCHPGVGADKRHFHADVVPLATRSKIADLDHVVLADQHTVDGNGGM